MHLLLIAFLAAFAATYLVVRSAASHTHLSGDTDKAQPQKFHSRVVPRIGGVSIVAGMLAALGAIVIERPDDWTVMVVLTGSGMIAFAAGLIEDFTKKVTPRQRLLATVAAATVAGWLADSVITRSDIPGLDTLLGFVAAPMLVTILAVAGVANSINIIDGFNGLASMCVAIMLAALAYVARQVGDTMIFQCAAMSLGAVLGFFVWNYPRGLIFLGDGGAYFLGFWVAELGILLIHRNESVSPLFPLLLCGYPVFETVFTMYRRKVVRGRPVGMPDASHLHSLIYRRLMRWAVGRSDAANLVRRNSMTSPYLWLLCSLSALPAVLWWNNSAAIAVSLALFCVTYIGLYRAIVHFHTPRWLVRKGARWVVPVAPAPQIAHELPH